MTAHTTSPEVNDIDWREKPAFAWGTWLQSLTFYDQLVYGVLLVLLGVGIGYLLFDGANEEGYSVNLFTEAISIFITVFILNGLNRRREEQRELRDLKARLLREARSTVNDVAVQAINEIRERGWLAGENGLLKGANLRGANLQGADLRNANLQSAYLDRARLQSALLRGADLQYAHLYLAELHEADLVSANLQTAILDRAHLRSASLIAANLQNASLSFARIQGANLIKADLRNANLNAALLHGADFSKSNLRGANLQFAVIQDANLQLAVLDENTLLRDGTKWSPDITQEEMTQRFGCVFISPDDKEAFATWKARREQLAADKDADGV